MSEQGRTYFDFLRSELDREYERRQSLQSRAASLGGFGTAAISAAAAVWAFAFGRDQTVTPAAAKWFVAALVLFLLSTLAAVFVFAIGLRRYSVVDDKTRTRMVEDHWVDSEVDARNVVASATSVTLSTLRVGNNRSALVVLVAGFCQAGALVALIAALVVESVHLVI